MINAAAASTPPGCPASVTPFTWEKVEPQNCDSAEAPGVRCYSRRLKADLLPGTFVLVLIPTSSSRDDAVDKSRNNHVMDATVARIVELKESCDPSAAPGTCGSSVEVNIFKRLTELRKTQEDFMYPDPLDENNLRFIPEVVQTQEIRSISSNNIINLAFVFTMESLKDSCNLFSTCQGMTIAFLLRYRLSHDVAMENTQILLEDLPHGFCRPFPSSYAHSQYHDCFPSRMWRSVICVKLETTKLLGRYSHHKVSSRKSFVDCLISRQRRAGDSCNCNLACISLSMESQCECVGIE